MWASKGQPTIALFTTEVEFMAASQLVMEVIWLRQFMADVGCMQEKATTIMCNNQSCVALAKKHIDVQHHLIREKVEEEVIDLR